MNLNQLCVVCNTYEAKYECTSYGFDHFLCEGCLKERHPGTLMFHVVDKMGHCGKERHGFANDILHADQHCLKCNSENEFHEVMIVTLKWTQSISILSCKKCSLLDDRLLSMRLFPGGSNRFVKCAFSLDVLSFYRELNLTSGISAYNVLNAIHKAQQNPKPPAQFVYRSFLRAMFEWRRMKLDAELLHASHHSDMFKG